MNLIDLRRTGEDNLIVHAEKWFEIAGDDYREEEPLPHEHILTMYGSALDEGRNPIGYILEVNFRSSLCHDIDRVIECESFEDVIRAVESYDPSEDVTQATWQQDGKRIAYRLNRRKLRFLDKLNEIW